QLNSKYEIMYNVTATSEFQRADAHELFLTPHCTAIFTAYRESPYDLTTYNVTNGLLWDSYFEEVDLATQELRFSWQASKHINPLDTFWSPEYSPSFSNATGFDWFHINSIEKDRNGNYLVSSRHMHAIYYIAGTTGEVIWTLGGKQNNFTDMSDGRATDFAWQHHVRWVDDDLTMISLFDNRNTAHHTSERPVSRGVILRLDYAKGQVWLEHEYIGQQLKSLREGSMQVLRDSPNTESVLVAYGAQPAWTEFDKNGTILWDVAFGPFHLDRESADSYRGLKFNWTGSPSWKPRIAPGPRPDYTFRTNDSTFHVQVEDPSGSKLANNTAYFSWNGATEIDQWLVLASNSTPNLTTDNLWAQIPKTGFEDSSYVGESTKFVKALAIDKNNRVLGQTDYPHHGRHSYIRATFTQRKHWRYKSAEQNVASLISLWAERGCVLPIVQKPVHARCGSIHHSRGCDKHIHDRFCDNILQEAYYNKGWIGTSLCSRICTSRG
ncbi:hypothetical protein K461DRAFT_233434, partial [Myriangium duriaei CBS 260.36]